MQVLVTGAAGFLGRECVNQLRARGHLVATTDRVGTVDHLGDLADMTSVRLLPPADAVVHCAAVQYVSRDLPILFRTAYFQRNNVLATRNVCERYSGTGTHMINIGTSMMYEQCRLPEYGTDAVLSGQGVYSASKISALNHVQRAFHDAATVIPCIIGGPGREGLFRGFVRSIMRWGVAVFPGSGDKRTHLVHVRDAATLVVRAMETRARGFLNAAGPGPLTIGDWVRVIASELRRPDPLLVRLPLLPCQTLARLTGYRLLAKEQLLMLEDDHVLDTSSSTAIGWMPEFDNERIVRDITSHIARAFHSSSR